MNMAKRPVQKIDFRPYGAAIKAARTGQKESRNKVMIAMISTAALAVGVIALSLSNGTTGDVNNYLFGSVLAMSESDLKLSVGLHFHF